MTEEELATRPYLEDQVVEYEAMLGEMRTVISQGFPGGEWTVDGEPSSAVADNALPEGRVGSSPIWVYSLSVSQSEADKQKAIDVITPIAKEYGFIDPIRFVDSEGRFQVVSDDGYGATFNMGSAKHVVLDFRTGVHRSRES